MIYAATILITVFCWIIACVIGAILVTAAGDLLISLGRWIDKNL